MGARLGLPLAVVLGCALSLPTVRAEPVDVLLTRDGNRLVGSLVSFDGERFRFEAFGQSFTVERDRVDAIYLAVEDPSSVGLGSPTEPSATPPGRPAATSPAGPAAPAEVPRRLLYVVSGAWPQTDETLKSVFAEAGYRVQVAEAVTGSLDGFDLVVYARQSPGDAGAPRELRRFIEAGGGCVFLAAAPAALADPTRQRDPATAGDTSALAEWLGARAFAGPGCVERALVRSPSMLLATADPFGDHPDWAEGLTLWSARGEWEVARTTRAALCEGARVIATGTPSGPGAEPGVWAYAYRFGEGRVYYQALLYDPRNPALLDLLVSGAAWAARGPAPAPLVP